MRTYYGTGPERTGLGFVTTHFALCLCGITEVRSDSLTSMLGELKEAGWTNGHELELAPMPGAQGKPTEWRCPECEVPCPRCRPDLRGEIYANRAKVGEVCHACQEEEYEQV